MVKLTQTTRRQQPTNCLSVFESFIGLALKWYTKGIANLHYIKRRAYLAQFLGGRPLNETTIDASQGPKYVPAWDYKISSTMEKNT